MVDDQMPEVGRVRRLRRCTFCPAEVEEDAQAAALHLLQACPRASDRARAAAVQVLLTLRAEAEAKAQESATRGGAEASGRALAATQVRLAWADRVGPVVAGLLAKAAS